MILKGISDGHRIFVEKMYVTVCLLYFFFPQSESGGAFKGFKGFVLPSGKGGGGFSGFGNGAGIKPLEGLSNGSSSVTSTPSFSSLKTSSETQTQSAFGKF